MTVGFAVGASVDDAVGSSVAGGGEVAVAGIGVAVGEGRGSVGPGAGVEVSVARTVASSATAVGSALWGDAVASLTTVVLPQPARARAARRRMMPGSHGMADVETQKVRSFATVHLSTLGAGNHPAASAAGPGMLGRQVRLGVRRSLENARPEHTIRAMRAYHAGRSRHLHGPAPR